MTRQKKLTLCFVALLGVGLHASAIYALHALPLGRGVVAFENNIAFEENLFALKERHARTQILSEIFENLTYSEPEVKENLFELKAEYAPTLDVSFDEVVCPTLSPEPFEFDGDVLSLAPIELEELISLEETPLTPFSLFAPQMELPPLANTPVEDDPYNDFGELAGTEHFDMTVQYTPKQTRPGYVFQLTFYPRKEVTFKRIRQNYFFLIDRSNSIPRPRYHLNKKAVAEALELLKPGDRFNILVFDNRVVRLSEELLTCSEENICKARSFLDRLGHGGFLAATELYGSLGKIIPKNVSDTEVNTAILLSDGDTFLTLEKQRKTIGGWTLDNKGKISLFSVASGSGNNLPLLDLLSAFNKGTLVYSQDHRKVSDRLKCLIETIQNPVGKEMAVTAITEDSDMTVLLEPHTTPLPDLYQERPFVIYGSTNRLSDFVVFLQGKYYDRRFDIKKKVSLNKAALGSHTIEKRWMQYRVQEHYENYFEDGDRKHLEAAKQLLTPLKLPVPLAH